MIKRFAGSINGNEIGFYACIENNELVIGEDRWREGGVLYRGEYRGENTPYLNEIKNENVKLYNSIVKYFKEHENEYKSTVMCSPVMTDMEKLNEIFSINKVEVKKQFPQLYYAILAVLDGNKTT